MDGLEVRTQLSTKIKEQEENAKSEKRTVLEKWKVIDLGFALFNQAHPLRWYTHWSAFLQLFNSFGTRDFSDKSLVFRCAKALLTKIM